MKGRAPHFLATGQAAAWAGPGEAVSCRNGSSSQTPMKRLVCVADTVLSLFLQEPWEGGLVLPRCQLGRGKGLYSPRSGGCASLPQNLSPAKLYILLTFQRMRVWPPKGPRVPTALLSLPFLPCDPPSGFLEAASLFSPLSRPGGGSAAVQFCGHSISEFPPSSSSGLNLLLSPKAPPCPAPQARGTSLAPCLRGSPPT